jgi:hypothetical protein
MTKGLRYTIVLLVLTVSAFWVVSELESPPQSSGIRLHTVGFDNRYGRINRLPIHVSVDGRTEQALVATCDPTTCTFDLSLPDAVHDIRISVQHGGRRSESARVTLDTRAQADR